MGDGFDGPAGGKGLAEVAGMPHLARSSCLGLVVSAALVTPAFADAPASPPSTAPQAPESLSHLVFPTLGPDARSSGLELGLGLQGTTDGDSFLKRFELGGQVVRGRVGGFARVGFAAIEGLSGPTNVELGGMYRTRTAATDTTLRLGLVVPTAPDDEDGLAPWASTLLARPSDLVLVGDATTLRLAAAPMYRSGALVLRADLGLDVVVDSEDEVDPLYHLDVAVGYEAGRGGVVAELQTVGSTGASDLTYHVAAFTAQLRDGKVAPHVTLSLPFSSEDGNDGAFNLLGGLRLAL